MRWLVVLGILGVISTLHFPQIWYAQAQHSFLLSGSHVLLSHFDKILSSILSDGGSVVVILATAFCRHCFQIRPVKINLGGIFLNALITSLRPL